MASHVQDMPRGVPAPREQPPEERVPGRGRFTSVVLAIGAIALILASGIVAVFYYARSTEPNPETPSGAQPGEILRPMVDLSK